MAIIKSVFGKLPCATEVELFTLENCHGTKLIVTPYGCRVISLWVKDRHGNLADVVLGHKTLEEYFGANYQGSFVGRYANRIGKATFTLEGKTFELTKNDGNNTLHGGPLGYHQVLWQVKDIKDGNEPSISFSHVSPDGDEGYPGKLDMTVTYRLTGADELSMEYSAVSDQKTPFNPTNHSFFNLTGNGQKTVFDTEMAIYAQKVTAVSEDLIPTGELVSVLNGPLDFTSPKALGKDMFAADSLIQLCGGFDHNFCVDGTGFRKMAEAYEPDSGRVMTVYSDMPGIQLYTFNKVSGLVGKDGKDMLPHSAFCLETQFYPDSVNHPEFPFAYLEAGVPFSSQTVYRFSVR